MPGGTYLRVLRRRAHRVRPPAAARTRGLSGLGAGAPRPVVTVRCAGGASMVLSPAGVAHAPHAAPTSHQS
ncbi:hypothetical protein LUTEI9C_140038 [Luteimonas sp. 9C]|nr:hypothetical protein LUTEI9C_140038 [Luteimonas sp. 9C]